MKKQITPLIYLITIILLSQIIIAIQPTQQYNQIYLNPFYRESMTNNNNYTYTLQVNPPDGISEVKNAIIKFDIYLTPTVTFYLWVNGQTCNNPSYQVHTTYMDSGIGSVAFDCSNIINKAGNYTIKLKPSGANTGASNGWLDLTYMNSPKAQMTMFGTEYFPARIGKIWLQLLDQLGNLTEINNGICYLNIYSPDNTDYLINVVMNPLGEGGLYYYDLLTPSAEGVYPAIAKCYYTNAETRYYPTKYTTIRGASVWTNLDSAYEIDANYFQSTENSPNPRKVIVEYEFNNMSNCTQVSETFLTGLSIYVYGRLDSVLNDDVTISIFNYTSNSWISLPNKILEGATYNGASNSIALNNITKAGLWNASQGMIIRTEDTNLTDTTNNGLFIDQIYIGCEQISSPKWIETKGSSEIHINQGQYYTIQYPIDNGIIYNYTTDKKFEFYYTIGSNSPILRLDEPITISLYEAFPCTHIFNVSLLNNSNYTSIPFTTSLNSGGTCDVNFELDLNGSTNYYIRIDADNFWKRKILSDKSGIEISKDALSNACYDYVYNNNLTNFTIPSGIESNYPNDSFYNSCEKYLDFYEEYNQHFTSFIPFLNTIYNFTPTEMDELDADYKHLLDVGENLKILGDILINNILLNAGGGNYTSGNYTLILQQILEKINLTDSRLINFSIATNQTLQEILLQISTNYNLTTQQINNIYSYLQGMNINISQNFLGIQNQLNNISYQQNLTFAEIQAINTTINQNIIDTQTMIMSINQTMLYQFNITNNKIDDLQMNLSIMCSNLQANITSQLNQIMDYLIYINQTTTETLTLAQQIWNYITSWLNGTINQIEYKLDLLLNASNITTNPITLTATHNAPCITGSDWIIEATVKGNYNQILTNNSVWCNITTDLWNTSSMTYNNGGYFEYRNTCPSPANWTYNITCEEI